MAAPATLTNWYQGQTANPTNNGILATGGVASNPTAQTPVTNSAPVLTPTTTQNAITTTGNATPTTISANPLGSTTPTTSSQSPSTYAGLQTASTQLGTPAQWNVDSNQTASGQLAGILSSGSPLMEQAKTAGLSSANERGLMNSSIASGASENAMIANAAPIAQQNAQAYSSAAQANQNAANAFATTNAANAFKAQENVYNQNVATANQQSSQQSSQQSNLQSQIGQMNSQFNNDVATIQTSQTMTQQAKDYAIQQLEAAYKTQITMLSAVGTVPDVTTLLSPIPGTTTATPPAPDYVAAPAPQPTTSGGGGGSVICTYYHSIGFMDDKTYDLDCAYGRLLCITNPDLLQWYWSWAYRFVEILQNNPKLTFLFWPLANAWSKEMIYQLGRSEKGSLLGKAVMFVGNTCCHIMKSFKDKGEVLCQSK